MAAIELEDDGFVEVSVKSPNGEGGETKKLDIYLVGTAISRVSKQWEAEGKPEGEWIKRTIQVFADHGLPGVSGKAAKDLADKIGDLLEAAEGKSDATSPKG